MIKSPVATIIGNSMFNEISYNMSDEQVKKKTIESPSSRDVKVFGDNLEKDDLKEETLGFPKDVDFKKFLGCGG